MEKVILKDFINVSKGFAYSINLKWDIDNLDKINGYVPTDNTLRILKKIINAKSGAHILVGSYGTGKSHFVSVLLSLLSGKYKIEDVSDLLEKIKYKDSILYNQIKNILISGKKNLIVFPEDSITDFKQAVLVGIKNALIKEKIDDILPKTYFDVIKEKIEDWGKNYSDVYDRFFEIIEARYALKKEEFIYMLNNFDKKSYEIFIEVYPDLTAGSIFIPIYYVDLIDFIEDLQSRLSSLGYDGIYIAFDEFGKYLEENIKIFNTKDIQDLAEFCSKKNSNCSLLLVTHKDFSQYTRKLNEDLIYEWRKIEGRFNKDYILTEKYQSLDIISKIILKDVKRWNEFKIKYQSKFNELTYNMMSIKLFADISNKYFNTLIDGVYPLNLAAAYCLIKLSEKLAQNERTMFTFLCSEQYGSLVSFINKEHNEFPLLNIEFIYDYFESLMKTDGIDSEVYNEWKKAQKAIQLLNKNDLEQINIIKALAVIRMINNFDLLPPDELTIRILLNISKKDFSESVNELLDKKILFYRKSIGHYMFYESSYIDIFDEIKKRKSNYKKDLVDILNDDFRPLPILPRKYNDDNYINRFFVCEFIDINNISKEFVKKDLEENYLDGKIYYLISKNETELKIAREIVKDELKDFEQAIFVIPKVHINFEEVCNRYCVLKNMLDDKEFLDKDPILKDEIAIYLIEARDQIYELLSKLTNNDYKYISFFYLGNELKEIRTRIQLSEKISEICKKVFEKTLVVNNELINKNNLTPTMKRVVSNVISKLWEDEFGENLGFKKFSAEHTLLKSMLINTGIFKKHSDKFIIDISDKNVSSDFRFILNEIREYFEKAKGKKIEFKELYKLLKSPPYGLRDGIIPILISLVIRDFKDSLYIKSKGVYQDIEPKLMLEMLNRPDKFTVMIDLWEKDKQLYTSALEKFFVVDNEVSKKNRLKALYIAMKDKFISLSKYSRVTSKLSKDSLLIRNIIEKDYTDYRELFYNRLPSLYNGNYKKTYEYIKKTFEEMKLAVYKLHKEIEEFMIKEFSNGLEDDRTLVQILVNWYSKLEEKTKVMVYDTKVNIFMDFVRNIDKIDSPIDFLASKMTGFSLDYWSDEQIENFKKDIKMIKTKVEDFQLENGDNKYCELSINYKGKEIKKILNDFEISFIGESLLEKIKDDIKNFGCAIDENEKRVILVKLLTEYL